MAERSSGNPFAITPWLIPILLTAFYGLVTPLTNLNGGLSHDGQFYAAMVNSDAVNPFFLNHPPYCWRVLSPLLASLLPFSPLESLEVVHVTATLLTLLLVVAVLRELRFSTRTVIAGTLLYGTLFFGAQSAFYTPAMIDPLSHFFVWLTIFLTARKLYTTVLGVIFVGAFQREAILLLSPILYLMKAERESDYQKNLLYLAALIVSALIPSALMQLLVPTSIPYHPEAVLRLTFLKQFGDLDFYPRFIIAFFSGLGVLPLLLLSFPKATLKIFRKHPSLPAFVIVGVVQLLGGTDKGRLFMAMVPGLVLTSAFLMEEKSRADSLFFSWIFTVVSVQFVLNASGVTFFSLKQLDSWIAPIYTQYIPFDSYARLGVLIFLWLAVLAIYSTFQKENRQKENEGET